jgi:xanthine permease
MPDVATQTKAGFAIDGIPLPRLIALGMQHVLVMYAGTVAVPLIVGSALNLPRDQVALLISADLFACGVATLIQSFGIGPLGIRMPVMMGVTFASVAPMLAIGNDPALGLQGIYGAVIVAGLFGIVVAPLISRLLPFFPPVVTGSIITVIGITLMRVGIIWAGGGAGIKDFGSPGYLGVAAFVLVVILLLLRYARGFAQNIAILLGIVCGYVLTIMLSWPNLTGLGAIAWVDAVYPFQFGLPRFTLVACLSMCLVMIVVMIESTGMFLALGDMTGQPVSQHGLTRGLRADGLSTLIGGVFNTFPYTSFSQNVGLVGITGIRSRFVCVAGGVIMLLLGLVPKLAFIVATVPPCVLGGAGIVMFGMVAAIGIKILAKVDFVAHRNSLIVVAISIGFGMFPLVAPTMLSSFPSILKPILDSGILLATISAVALNAFFSPIASSSAAKANAIQSANVPK